MLNRILTTIVTVLLITSSNYSFSQRYLSEIFSDVTVTSDVVYANNITVITGMPVAEDLLVDIYEPTGDTETERPLIIIAHDGDFLPYPINGRCVGAKNDSAIVEMCNQFARRGYVAASISYRLGWNPASGMQDVLTGTYVNALYRGTQDMRTAVRFFRQESLSYGVDTSRIIIGGSGTGAALAFSTATLDDFNELELSKFINPSTTTSFVDTSLSSNIYGTTTRPLNIPNHTGFSSDVDFMFSLGGFCPDSSWLESGDVPMVGFHSPSNPYSPYNYGPVIEPTNGNFLLNVSGTGDMLEIANTLGNQNVWGGTDLSGPFTSAADAINNGNEGLYPFYAPTPTNNPWQWWDPNCLNHASSVLTNPNMSPANGMAYIDTVMGYVNKRIVCALSLPGCNYIGLDETSMNETISVYPNPSNDYVLVSSDQNSSLKKVTLRSLAGKELRFFDELTSSALKISKGSIPSGVYLLEVETDEKIFIRRVIFE